MTTSPQRIAGAFAVLRGRYGDVTKSARDRVRSRQSLDREPAQAIDAVDGTAAQARVAEPEQQLTRLRSRVHDLRRRLGRAVEMTPEKGLSQNGVRPGVIRGQFASRRVQSWA